MSQEILFSGKPMVFGGLGNEVSLAQKCPEEFQRNNPWSNYAMDIFFQGGNIKNWEWKSEDDEIKAKQLACFHGLLGTFELSRQNKQAVAGWMLSEMLQSVPEHIPVE